MKRYNPTDIEQKWQMTWEREGTYEVDLRNTSKPNYLGFSMLPGITGAGIHTGHGRTFQFSDIKVRAKRQQGYNAYHPIGWDSFGLPVENYAIKIGKKPLDAHNEAKSNFIKQLKRLGYSYDWSKEISTADPRYYRWTQWIFNQLLQHDLAYQKESPQWWCETDQTVLANEQVEGGNCWRCGNPVVKKNLKQWFFRITAYADEMLEATDDLNWTDMVKTMQKNWIGKSQGAEIEFVIEDTKNKPNFVLFHGYTGRADKNWIPKLKSDLESKGYNVQAPQLPNTDNPTEFEQVRYALENCTFDENTVIVGHSLGGAVAMKVIEQLSHSVRELILIAPVVDQSFRYLSPVPRPFWDTFDLAYNYDLIKMRTSRRVILSDTQEKENRMPYLEYLTSQIDAEYIQTTARKAHYTADEEPDILSALTKTITVFTTRPDTLFGATFLVLAPEHELAKQLTNSDTHDKVIAYIDKAARKSEIERMSDTREKSGVFTGSYAINPATGQKMPIWVADYVLSGYGSGAIMAVPAHDERDFAFAQLYDLPVITVVEPEFGTPQPDEIKKDAIIAVLRDPRNGKVLVLDWGERKQDSGGVMFVGGGIEEGEDPVEAARREITEETGFTNFTHIVTADTWVNNHFYSNVKSKQYHAKFLPILFELDDDTQIERQLDDNEDQFTLTWIDEDMLAEVISEPAHYHGYKTLTTSRIYHDEGVLVNSGAFDGMQSSEAREEIVAWLEEQGTGRTKTTFKMRDWLISRQRYWGAPIPVVHTESHGVIAIADDQLPVVLPDVEDYKPQKNTGGGATSVLATVEDWVHVWIDTQTTETVPYSAGKPAGDHWVEGHRETDTMDGYACSSWYFLRYIDPFNDKQAWDPELAKQWQPVDFYNGGDHAVAHLLYSRFWMRFFYKLGLVPDPEPFKRMMYNGYIMAPDGTKMSKSKGNTIDPLEIMDSGYGADSLRVYEMFIAPYDLDAPWDVRGVPGTYRFLNRTWNLVQEYIEAGEVTLPDAASREILTIAHKTAKKVTSDIEDDKFNTAVSSMMEAVNAYYKLKEVHGIGNSDAWKFALESLLQILAPFAPHITEELWSDLGHTSTIHVDNWPKWDDSYLVSDTTTIIVQVNGKVRAKFEVPADTTEDDIKSQALSLENVSKFVTTDPKKVIYIKGKLLNIVL